MMGFKDSSPRTADCGAVPAEFVIDQGVQHLPASGSNLDSLARRGAQSAIPALVERHGFSSVQ